MSIRYLPGKIWTNFLIAVAAGIAIVVVLNILWSRGALPGGIGGLVAIVALLLPGVIKRGARTEPIVTIDQRGISIELLGIGTIAWDRIRSARIVGTAWWTGQRLVVEYAGKAPKAGFWEKMNWGLIARQKGEIATLSLAYLNMTDQPKSAIEAALARLAPRAA